MSTVIEIEGLSKRYRLGVINRKMLYKDIQSWWARLRGHEDPNAPILSSHQKARAEQGGEFWALRDITCSFQQGDVVGIIGKNGAGKSTLLKVLSNITSPTTGTVRIKGLLASLLEVGTGFHPDLTGRENVYLNGAILGMGRAEVNRKFDEIVSFADLEEFIDTPVKRYSSGMYVRLAFAVAAHLEPDILVVDEVLAVGDAVFQKKCLGVMGEAAKSGRTILFVSHNPAAVENLCTTGIVLEDGKITFSGTQIAALQYYSESIEQHTEALIDRRDRKGSGEIRVVDIRLLNGNGQRARSFSPGAAITIELDFENLDECDFPHLIVAIGIKSHLDILLFYGSNYTGGQNLGRGARKKKGKFVCELPHMALMPGLYRVDYKITSQPRGAHLIDNVENAIEFEISHGDYYGSGQLPGGGLLLTPMNWKTES